MADEKDWRCPICHRKARLRAAEHGPVRLIWKCPDHGEVKATPPPTAAEETGDIMRLTPHFWQQQPNGDWVLVPQHRCPWCGGDNEPLRTVLGGMCNNSWHHSHPEHLKFWRQPELDEHDEPEYTPEYVYEKRRREIQSAIEIGIDAERGDPTLTDLVSSFTPEQIDWLACWLASENIGKLP